MVSEVATGDWLEWKESTEELKSLENFYTEWRASHKKVTEVWKSFRLLPLNCAYLMASHYQYDQFGWSFKTCWNLYVEFDKALKTQENPSKIEKAIASALATQKKMVALQKVFATLTDRQKTLQDKARVYQELKKDNAKLYQDLIHKIWVVHRKAINKNTIETKLSENPEGLYSQLVIQKMVSLCKEGHPKLDDFFFDKLIEKKAK